MQCSTLECYSEAVVESTDTGRVHCAVCGLKVMALSGPSSLRTLPNAKFPWDYPADAKCGNCGRGYNRFMIGLTGECPSCRNNIPLPVKPTEVALPGAFLKASVKYEEGQHD